MTLTIMALVFVSLIAFSAIAEETEDPTTSPTNDIAITTTQEYPELAKEPGITPDMPVRYGLKLGWERASLAFTLNKQRKAEKNLELAEKRLIEMKKMLEKGKIEQAEKLRERYENRIEKSEEILAELKEDGKEEVIIENIKKNIKLQLKIGRNEAVIEALKDYLEEKNLTEERREKAEDILEKLSNRTEKLKEKAEEREEKVKDRLRAVTNKNESEINEIVDKLETEEGLEQARKIIAENWIARTESSLTRIKARIDEEKLKGMNLTEIESYLKEVEAKLNEAKQAYNSGDYKRTIEILKPINNYGRILSQAVKIRNQERIGKLREAREKQLEKIKAVEEKPTKAEKITGQAKAENKSQGKNK